MFEWSLDPAIFRLGSLQLRYYSLLFMGGIFAGYHLVQYFARKEGKSTEHFDSLLMIGVASIIIGARLGHVFFYEPQWIFKNPLQILKVWEGGLASHGAAIAIPIGLYIFVRKYGGMTYFWLIDRVCVVIPLAAFMIRLGNFFNSEIFGKPTGGNWGVVFKNIDNVPRHPTQLYEAAAYLVSFGIMMWVYRYKKDWANKPGFLLGAFLVLIFGFRFFVEYLKANQVAFENGMLLNMGQILSIPAVVIGLILMLRKTSSTS